jgi:serine/threonine-protein kinase Chk2
VKEMSIKNYESFCNERDVLTAYPHPNIVGLIHAVERKQSCFLLLQKYDQDLFTFLQKMGPLSEKNSKVMMVHLIDVVLFLHGNGVTHRDIKPENILLNNNDLSVPFLCDFGMANQNSVMKGYCGTPTYIAPEILAENEYTNKVDNWSLGVTFFIMLHCYHPFDPYGDLPIKEINCVSKNGLCLDSPLWEPGLSLETKKVVVGLLHNNPRYRMSLQEARRVLVPPPTPPPPPAVKPWWRRRWSRK